MDCGLPRPFSRLQAIMQSSDANKHPLSPERAQVVQEAQAKIDALQARKTELAAQEAAANNVLKNSSNGAGSVAREPLVEKAVRGLSSAEVAKLDLGSLGISDKDAISWADPAIKSLNSSSAALAEKLGSVGTLLNGTIKPKLADNLSTVESRGVKELDKPTVFDPTTEMALKLEMRTYGLLPSFTNPALADLPVATQLQVTNAMKATAARQEQLIKQGVDPNVAAKQAFDEKANDIVASCLLSAVDKYGIGDIPGVQEFVGGALGELSAQFGISPSGMADTLMAGDFKKIAGTPEQAAKAVAKQAEKIFTDPKAAGIDVAKGTYEVLKAGGEAALAVFTGPSNSAEKAAASQAAVAARQKELSQLSGALIQVENDRQAAVAARDRNLEQAKEIIVAQKQLNEINRQTAVDIPIAEQQAKFQLGEVTANARREQIAQDIAPKAAEQQKAYDAQLAQAKAEKDKLSAQLNALAAAAPAGKGGP